MFYFSWPEVLTLSLKNQQFLNFNCVLLIIQFAEGLNLLMTHELGLISSLGLDGRKDVQPIKSTWSIYIQRFAFLRGIIRDIKQTTHCSTYLKSAS